MTLCFKKSWVRALNPNLTKRNRNILKHVSTIPIEHILEAYILINFLSSRHSHMSHSCTSSSIVFNDCSDSFSLQPTLLWHNQPTNHCKQRNRHKNDTRKIKRIRRHGEIKRRKQNCSSIQIPHQRNPQKGPTPLAQVPFRVGEFARREEEATECDKGVGSDSGNAGGTDERGEGDGRGEDGAKEGCANCPDHFDGITRLAVRRDL